MNPCHNCGDPTAADKLHCPACEKEAAKAPKMADDINNVLERAGHKLRFHQDQVRQALLATRKRGGKS
jgi:predicted amidophosphoribosyltransferase